MSIPLASGTVITRPVPLYANVSIHSEYYEPDRFVITAVDLGPTTTITTSVDHNYVIGQQCRLVIPPTFGCRQLNGISGFAINLPTDNQVTLDINSIGFDPYVSSSATTVAQILAIGSINTGATNTSGRADNATTIPGAFIDVSP